MARLRPNLSSTTSAEGDIIKLFALVEYYQEKYNDLNEFPLNSDYVPDKLAEMEWYDLRQKYPKFYEASWYFD